MGRKGGGGMSCKYCKNQTKNEYLVKSWDIVDGVEAKVIKHDGTALLAVSGWFDNFVAIGTEYAEINYCPMCGSNLLSRQPA